MVQLTSPWSRGKQVAGARIPADGAHSEGGNERTAAAGDKGRRLAGPGDQSFSRLARQWDRVRASAP